MSFSLKNIAKDSIIPLVTCFLHRINRPHYTVSRAPRSLENIRKPIMQKPGGLKSPRLAFAAGYGDELGVEEDGVVVTVGSRGGTTDLASENSSQNSMFDRTRSSRSRRVILPFSVQIQVNFAPLASMSNRLQDWKLSLNC